MFLQIHLVYRREGRFHEGQHNGTMDFVEFYPVVSGSSIVLSARGYDYIDGFDAGIGIANVTIEDLDFGGDQSIVQDLEPEMNAVASEFINILKSRQQTEYVFGLHNRAKALALADDIESFSNNWLPIVKVFSSGSIQEFDRAVQFRNFATNSENSLHPELQGAYDTNTQTIFLSEAVLNSDVNNELRCVLVQELAHHIDKIIEGDANGAEGLIAVQKICHPSEALSDVEHYALRNHDDKANISIQLLDGTSISLQNVELGFWKTVGIIALVTVSVAVAATGVGAIAEALVAGAETAVVATEAAVAVESAEAAIAVAAEGDEIITTIVANQIAEDVGSVAAEAVETQSFEEGLSITVEQEAMPVPPSLNRAPNLVMRGAIRVSPGNVTEAVNPIPKQQLIDLLASSVSPLGEASEVELTSIVEVSAENSALLPDAHIVNEGLLEILEEAEPGFVDIEAYSVEIIGTLDDLGELVGEQVTVSLTPASGQAITIQGELIEGQISEAGTIVAENADGSLVVQTASGDLMPIAGFIAE